MTKLTPLAELDALIRSGLGEIPREQPPPCSPEEAELERRRQEKDREEARRRKQADSLTLTPDEVKRLNRMFPTKRSHIAIEPREGAVPKEALPKLNPNKSVAPGVYPRRDQQGVMYYILVIGGKARPERFRTIEEASGARQNQKNNRENASIHSGCLIE